MALRLLCIARTTSMSECPTCAASVEPEQNQYVQSFGSRLRDELQAVEDFTRLLEAQ